MRDVRDFDHEVRALAKLPSGPRSSPNGIVFVGSSMMRCWTTLVDDFDPLPVRNHGFGGSQTHDVLRYLPQLIFFHQPKLIVYYCGSNDVCFGHSAKDILQRQADFAAAVRQNDEQSANKTKRGTVILFMSILRAPEKRESAKIVDELNMGMEEMCRQNPEMFIFFDSNAPMEVAVWKPLGSMTQAMICTSPRWRTGWREALFPVVKQVFESIS